MMIDVVLVLIVLHTPAGHEVLVNPAYVASLRVPTRASGDDERLYTDRANCLVNTLDGKNVAVREACADVRDMIERAER